MSPYLSHFPAAQERPSSAYVADEPLEVTRVGTNPTKYILSSITQASLTVIIR
ncbi:MAG: hypothetical protein JO333_01545 [Verrucomicrobia bacterium]|nr:hypothetical protein [Verrucomicrobiota bacterium]